MDAAVLLGEITRAVGRHVQLGVNEEEGQAAQAAIALWVVHAHAFAAARCAPRLLLTSPTKRCGKTTALRVLHRLTPRPLSASNLTAPTIFRAIEAVQPPPVLLIDEADTFINGAEGLRSVINSGHGRDMAFVLRCTGDDHEVKRFSTWAPMVVAMIGSPWDALVDRSIRLRLTRKLPSVKLDPLRDTEHLDLLARKAARWAQDNIAVLRAARPQVPDQLNDRAADNWEPLLAIADQAGGEWPDIARVVAVRLGIVPEHLEPGEQLLHDLREVFMSSEASVLPSREIVACLLSMSERPWRDMSFVPDKSWRGSIGPHQVAKLLRPFGIEPCNLSLPGKPKGYKSAHFEDAWARYLGG